MNYQYKLIVKNKNIYKEFEIPADMEKVKVGTTSTCEFRLSQDVFFEEIEIELNCIDGKWKLNCCDNLYINKGDSRKLFFSEIEHDDLVYIYYSNSNEKVLELRFMIDFNSEFTNFCLKMDIANFPRIVIGDVNTAHIILSSDYSTNTLVELVKTQEGLQIVEKKSVYGIYVNGKKIRGSYLVKNMSFITIGDFSVYYKDETLFFGGSNIKLNGIENYVSAFEKNDYPMFVRNTRVKSIIDEEPIKILDPASIPSKPESNIVTSLMPSIAMFALVVVLRGIMSNTGGTFVLFSICSMGLGIITTVISIVEKKKKYKKDCKDRVESYNKYINNKKSEIEYARERELQCLREKYYCTEEDINNILSFSSKLFDRIPEDDDFLETYLGTGTVKAKKKIDYKLQEKLEIGDDLCTIPNDLSEEYKYIYGAPVTIELKEANAIGVVGTKEQLYEVMKVMLVDIISRQYFGDVKIYTLIDDEKKYDWIRLLPHIQNAGMQRNIVCDNESKNNVFEELYKELNTRSGMKKQIGFNVIFVMCENGIKSHPISKFIEKASELNTVFIFFETAIDKLPLHCSKIIQTYSLNEGKLYDSKDKSDYREFRFTNVSDDILRRAIELLAPVYCEEISLEGSLRKSITLFELLGIYSASDLDLSNRWNSSKIYDTIAVPLGVNVKDEIVYLDLHEKYHGPHGLVAGTTGSGKSEILQTYILGAATLFHPYEIGFVIIDFKGGGMVNQFKNLPHLMGAITNIDGKAIDRSLK